jgi:hypothetical protein
MEQFSDNQNTMSGQPLQAPKPNRFFEREYIDSLHEDVVKDIISLILRKAGNQEAMERFIPFQEVFTYMNANDNSVGSYHPETHVINLNKGVLLRDNAPLTKTLTLATLIHEELHAVTRKEDVVTGDGFGIQRVIGFEEQNFDAVTKSIQREWARFNEGLTELIKDDIITEYLKRTGDSREIVLRGYEGEENDNTYQTYQAERVLVNKIIMRIHNETGVSLDAVREGFVQAYFSDISFSEIKTMVKELCGESVAKTLDDVPVEVLEEQLKNSIQKYILTHAKSAGEAREFGKEFLVIMATNYMRRGLVD